MKNRVILTLQISFLSSKEGRSLVKRHTIPPAQTQQEICRAMKRNGFDTELPSQITLHRCCFQRTITMQSNLLRQPGIKPIAHPCAVVDQIATSFSPF